MALPSKFEADYFRVGGDKLHCRLSERGHNSATVANIQGPLQRGGMSRCNSLGRVKYQALLIVYLESEAAEGLCKGF